MTASATTVRRGLFGVFAGGILAFGSAAIVAPVATAQPEPAPDCSAAGVAGTVSTATASEGAYLVAHPQTNEALSEISTQPQEQAQPAYNAYFGENPQVKDELQAIYQPVGVLRDQCGIDMTPTPVAQAVWSDAQAPVAPEGAQQPAADTPESSSS